MSADSSFTDQVTRRVETDDVGGDVEYVKFHDQEFAFYTPTTAQMAYMAMALNGDNIDTMRQVGMAINFIVNLMEDDDARRFRSLLLDRNSGIEDDDILDLYEDVMERWSSRPTESPSDSSPSPEGTGRRLTGDSRRGGSIRSTSRRAGSSTSRTRS